jgi:hypothetical protein
LVLEEAEIPLKNMPLTLVKGFFADTLPFNDSKQIALLNIDGDLYQSYRDCLSNLFHKLSSGGVILFDDFGEEGREQSFPGARRAVKEFLGDEYSTIKKNKFGVYYYGVP